ncbi:MAG: hypothetical protein WD883_00955 [Candidatus Colwellbacteria bacterium]
MDVLGGIANFLGLDEVAGKFVQGIASLFGFIVEVLGKLLFFVGDSMARMSIEMNTLLPESPVITEGLGITIPFANIAIVVGLIVLAFAIMTRAEWIATARDALPKLLTAILLINFTYFALVHVAIRGVDSMTLRLYEASNYNEDTFRGIFQPDFSLKEVLRIRLAMAKANSGEIEDIENYFSMMNKISLDVSLALDELNEALPPEIVVTSSQRYAAINNTSRFLGYWFADPFLQDGGSWVSIGKGLFYGSLIIVASALTFGTGGFIVGAAITAPAMLSAIDNAQKNVYGALDSDWNREDLVKGLVGALESSNVGYAEIVDADTERYHQQLLASINSRALEHFGCDMESAGAKSKESCQSIERTAALIFAKGSVWEETAMVLAEVLFKTIWIFIGTLTLFGLASMFFIRYIALAILVILFPIVWFGWIFPKIATAGGGKNIWTAWWSQFIRWLLFGPLAMFFIFLAVKTSTQLGKINPFLANPGAFNDSTMAIMASSIGDMLIVIGFLIGGLYTANKMGIAGSKLFYGSAIKARGWVGKQVKRGATAPLRYAGGKTKQGFDYAKSAAKANLLDVKTRHLRTDDGAKRSTELAESGNVLKRYRGLRRQKAAFKAEDTVTKHAQQRYMARDAEGKKVQMPGGQRRAAQLRGLLAQAQREEAKYGAPRRSTLRDMIALHESVYDDGYHWETAADPLVAMYEKYGAWKTFGRQKFENGLIGEVDAPEAIMIQEYELKPALMAAIRRGDSPQEIERIKDEYRSRMTEARMKQAGEIDPRKLKIDSRRWNDVPEDTSRAMFGVPQAVIPGDPAGTDELRKHMAETNRGSLMDFAFLHRSELIPQGLRGGGGTGKPATHLNVAHKSRATYDIIDQVIPGFSGLPANEKLRRAGGLGPDQIEQIKAAAASYRDGAIASNNPEMRRVASFIASDSTTVDGVVDLVRNYARNDRTSLYQDYVPGVTGD